MDRERRNASTRGAASTLALAIALAAPGTAAAQGAPPDLEAAMRQALQASQARQQAERPQIVALQESDVTGFIGAMSELKRLDPSGNALGESLADFNRTVATDSRVKAILSKNGLSAETMPQIAYSISMAIGSLETSQAEIDEARSAGNDALARMKAQLTPEQYELMKQQMGAFDASIAQLQKQPEGNVQLVQKYRAQLEAALGER